jgi:hypothetical protein
MDKRQKIILLIVGAILFVGIISALMWQVSSLIPHCTLDSGLICQDQLIGNDGFMITFGNQNEKRIYIQDITISKSSGERCSYLKPEIVNLEKDYYATIGSNEATTFFITTDHPDGECLLRGLSAGNNYAFDIEITYFLNSIKKVARGSGVALYMDKNLDIIAE